MLQLHAVIFIETITKLVKVIFVNTMRGNTILIILMKCFKFERDFISGLHVLCLSIS